MNGEPPLGVEWPTAEALRALWLGTDNGWRAYEQADTALGAVRVVEVWAGDGVFFPSLRGWARVAIRNNDGTLECVPMRELEHE